MTPALTAAYALASPAPRVLWKCPPSGRSPITGRSAAISERHPAGRGGADGVGDREPVDAAIAGGRGDVEDPPGRGWSLERAVPRGGDDDLDGDVAAVRDGDDLVDLVGGLRAAAPDVGVAEGVAGRHHVLD